MSPIKAQYSMEYIIVMGFALLMSISILTVFFMQTNDINDRVNLSQLDSIVRKMADSSEKIYYLGEPSQTILKVYMPNKVRAFTIKGRELIFIIEASWGEVEVFRTTSVNVTGNISVQPGPHRIKIQAQNSVSGVYVLLSEA